MSFLKRQPISGPATPRRAASLRQQLTFWQIVSLAFVVLLFGSSAFGLVWRGIYRQAEADLLGAAQLLARDIHSEGEAGEFSLTKFYEHRLGRAPRDRAYIARWDAQGRFVSASSELPEFVRPAEKIPKKGPRQFIALTQGRQLAVVIALPDGGQLAIGRPLAKEYDQLYWLLAELLAMGALTLLLGAALAVWLAGQIAGPLESLARQAESVAPGRTGQRMQLQTGPAEALALAAVLNAMLERVQTAIRRQIQFTADASHELRTPVTVVLTQAEHALSRPRDAESYRTALETCLRAAQRMKRLVEDLLTLARSDSGRQEYRNDPLNLAAIAEQAADLLASVAVERNVRLESNLQSATVSGDGPRLVQVATNLINNALLYTPAGGVVRVTVEPTAAGAQLIVHDTGIGIAPEDQQRLFERFYRGDPAQPPFPKASPRGV